MPQGRERRRAQRQPAAALAAGAADDLPLGRAEHRVLNIRPPAHGAELLPRRIALDAHQAQLERGLDGRAVPQALAECIQTVQAELHELGLGLFLGGILLEALGKIAAQRKALQILPQTGKALLRDALAHREAPVLLKQRQLGIGQQLGRRGDLALLAQGPVRCQGQLARVGCQGRQDAVRLAEAHLAQDQGVLGTEHRLSRCSRSCAAGPASRASSPSP